MRTRNIKNAKERILKSEYFIENPMLYKGKWHDVFKNDNPIHIEIGMGKGIFITTLCKKNPHINYIGIEKFDSIMLRAVEKLIGIKQDNIKMILLDAISLQDVFDEKEISRIYLNFSDPWPKKSHEKRRLTNKRFLNIYDNILTNDAEIHFKTDNIHLFEYSIESFNQHGYLFKNISLDLHKSDFVDNIETEYESKYSKNGPIYRLECFKR